MYTYRNVFCGTRQRDHHEAGGVYSGAYISLSVISCVTITDFGGIHTTYGLAGAARTALCREGRNLSLISYVGDVMDAWILPQSVELEKLLAEISKEILKLVARAQAILTHIAVCDAVQNTMRWNVNCGSFGLREDIAIG